MAATSRFFPFFQASITPSSLNTRHFNTAATSFAHSLKIRSCRIVFELVIDLTNGARARNSTDAARARDDIYATQPARYSVRAGHVITGRLSSGGHSAFAEGIYSPSMLSRFLGRALAALKL